MSKLQQIEIKNMTLHYKCTFCTWEGSGEDLELRDHPSGDYDLPPDYTHHCPDCGLDSDYMTELKPEEEN